MTLMSGLVLDTGRHWGEVAVDVQRDNAQAVLTARSHDPVRLFWHELPKGHSKTTDAACMSVVWLLEQADDLAEGYIVSSDEDQSNRLLNRARVVIRKTGLESALKVESKRILNTSTGAFVAALAADVSSSEGLLSPWIVVDELPRWKTTHSAQSMWVSVFSGHPKAPGARLTVLGHSGDPGHWSFKIRERARKSSRWRFVHADGPTGWLSEDDLAEQQALLLPSQYAQRYLNQWTASEDRLTTREDLAACVTLDGPAEPQHGVHYQLALDMGFVNDAAVAVVCHRQDDRVLLDRIEAWQGSRRNPVQESVVEDWLIEASRRYNQARLRLDPWQTKGMAQRLRSKGLRVEELNFNAQSVGRLALTLHRLIREHRLAIYDDEALIDELANVQLRETNPGVYRLDHAADGHDDRAVALAMAAEALIGASDTPLRIFSPVRRHTTENGRTVVASDRLLSGSPGGQHPDHGDIDALAEHAFATVGKKPTGQASVRPRGSYASEPADPRTAGSRPGWGRNRR